VTLPFVLQLKHAGACRRSLDGRALAEWARRRIAAGDFLDEEGKQWLLDAEREGREGSRCLLDEVLEVLRRHGVTIELENDGGPY
jgi:gamma-glutamyl:cysteine ligase YbdK (ATP-grasp superfamily)